MVEINGERTTPVYKRIRKKVIYQPGDVWWLLEIEKVVELIEEKVL
jgi:hypothetical protein